MLSRKLPEHRVSGFWRPSLTVCWWATHSSKHNMNCGVGGEVVVGRARGSQRQNIWQPVAATLCCPPDYPLLLPRSLFPRLSWKLLLVELQGGGEGTRLLLKIVAVSRRQPHFVCCRCCCCCCLPKLVSFQRSTSPPRPSLCVHKQTQNFTLPGLVVFCFPFCCCCWLCCVSVRSIWLKCCLLLLSFQLLLQFTVIFYFFPLFSLLLLCWVLKVANGK